MSADSLAIATGMECEKVERNLKAATTALRDACAIWEEVGYPVKVADRVEAIRAVLAKVAP